MGVGVVGWLSGSCSSLPESPWSGGAEWARWVRIIAAFVALQPLWTILSVALALLLIFPLVAYGGRHGMLGTYPR
jgi:hypothetical protein